MKKMLFISLVLFLTVSCSKPKPEHKPETQIAEIIGKSFQNSPEDWEITNEDIIPFFSDGNININETYQIYNKKCDLIINLFPGHNIKDIPIYGSCMVNNVELSDKDVTYINYQFNTYILSVHRKKEAKRKLKEFEQQQYVEKIKQDSLRKILITELKQNNCL